MSRILGYESSHDVWWLTLSCKRALEIVILICTYISPISQQLILPLSSPSKEVTKTTEKLTNPRYPSTRPESPFQHHESANPIQSEGPCATWSKTTIAVAVMGRDSLIADKNVLESERLRIMLVSLVGGVNEGFGTGGESGRAVGVGIWELECHYDWSCVWGWSIKRILYVWNVVVEKGKCVWLYRDFV